MYSCDFERTGKNYALSINFDRRILEHNCRNFEMTKIKNKGFCKHITKVFLKIKDEYNENYARKLLNYIYWDLNFWEFKLS